MTPWKGPATTLAVLLALLQFGPSGERCEVLETNVPPPPPPLDGSTSLRIRPDAPGSPDTAAADPFALSVATARVRTGADRPRATGPAPGRPWRVTGLVGRRAAVLVGPDGGSVVVSVGQTLDSARVVGISSAGVEMEDRGGRFLLKVR